jgi:hypothetical protein
MSMRHIGWGAAALLFAFAASTAACDFLRPIPARTVPADASVATWVIDPDSPPVGFNATAFAALVTERACTGARRIDGLIMPPVIEYGEREIVVRIFVEPLAPGDYECPGNPPSRFVVQLDQPVRGRTLVDGNAQGEQPAAP